jgi:hypothetical protein
MGPPTRDFRIAPPPRRIRPRSSRADAGRSQGASGQPTPTGEAVMAWPVTISPTWFDPSTAPPQITPFRLLRATWRGAEANHRAFGEGRLPTMYPWRTAVEASGLMSYQVDWSGSSRRAALRHKILKGAKPGDLPWSSRPSSTGHQSQDRQGPRPKTRSRCWGGRMS